tara:strand:- start:888 stop:1091 length:204 start_codon:yes stop_codon:yes gene_type:complete
MKILDYLLIALVIALLMLAVSCTKEDDDRCINYLVEQYQKDDIQCSDGICEVTYITEIYCSYYENSK